MAGFGIVSVFEALDIQYIPRFLLYRNIDIQVHLSFIQSNCTYSFPKVDIQLPQAINLRTRTFLRQLRSHRRTRQQYPKAQIIPNNHNNG